MPASLRVGSILVPMAFCISSQTGACGATPPPPAEPPSTTSSHGSPDDPGRPLTKSECESLAQTIVEACNGRGNERSAGMDGWCSDMVSRNAGDGTWVDGDCLKHVKYMDYFCFQSAKNAHGMMECDRTVDRSQ
jgi:hypothetical protein